MTSPQPAHSPACSHIPAFGYETHRLNRRYRPPEIFLSRAMIILMVSANLCSCALGRRISAAEQGQVYNHCQRYADAPSASSLSDPGRCVSVERAISGTKVRTADKNGHEALNSSPPDAREGAPP